MQNQCPKELREGIDAVKELFKCGVAGTLTFEGAIIVWRRPVHASYDDRNRPHEAAGPSVLWQDGFKQYAHHGLDMRRASWALEDSASITAEKALAEPNVEIRRALVELMGLERFLAGAEATVIDEVKERDGVGRPINCRLLRLKVDGSQADLALREVTCPSTGKVIHLEVPIEVATSYAAARAWAAGTDSMDSQEESIWET